MADERREVTAVRIDPEPDANERVALERVLVRLRSATATPRRSAWWRIGVRENVADAADERPL